jgi:hypothetical protein
VTLRTSRREVTFRGPFRLPGLREDEPPGTYLVESDEEPVESLSHTVYRRVATWLIIDRNGTTRAIAVQPDDLAAALERDRLAGLSASDPLP